MTKIENTTNIFGLLGYLFDVISKPIKKFSKLNRPLEQGPNKFPEYLRMSYLDKETNYLKSKIHESKLLLVQSAWDNTFHKNPLNLIYKYVTKGAKMITLYTNLKIIVIVST